MPDEFPEWINDAELSLPKTDNINNNTDRIDFSNWEYFQIKKLFKIERGTITSLNELESGFYLLFRQQIKIRALHIMAMFLQNI